MSTNPTPIKSRPPALQPSESTQNSSSNIGSPLSDTFTDSARSPSSETGGLLSKTYVIPPRPKPGRKPATDTPQTKRKEQNREAQRAFRERRAARVGELEDEISHKKQEWLERENALEQALQNQQRAFQREVEALQAQHRELESALANERRLRLQAEAEAQSLRSENKRRSASSMTSYPSGGSTPWSQRAVSPVTQEKLAHRASQPSSRNDAGRRPSNKDAFDPSCGSCSQGGHCACLDQAFARNTNVLPRGDTEPMEMDFTTSPRPAKCQSHSNGNVSAAAAVDSRMSEYAPHNATPNSESCGFCTDSQNCVCNTYQEALKPPQQQPGQFTKLPSIQAPGTCDRCMQDPERQRFCQMLAQTPAGRPPNRTLPSIDEKMSMSCDEAYDRLSREPAFRDRDSRPSVIRRLRARPAEATRDTDEGAAFSPKSALEVDIASVLAAMRAERTEEQKRSGA